MNVTLQSACFSLLIHGTTDLFQHKHKRSETIEVQRSVQCLPYCTLLYFNSNEEGMNGVSGLHRVNIILKSYSTLAFSDHFKFQSTGSSPRNT